MAQAATSTDPNAALLAHARVVRAHARAGAPTPELPLLIRRGARASRVARTRSTTTTTTVCAAYNVTCVDGSSPPRATLSLASGVGGLGLGEPAGAPGRWRLRARDFCKGPPPELGAPTTRFHRLPKDVPHPEHCICPTNSLERRGKPSGSG